MCMMLKPFMSGVCVCVCTWKRDPCPWSRAGLRGATGLRLLQKWMEDRRGLGASSKPEGVYREEVETHTHALGQWRKIQLLIRHMQNVTVWAQSVWACIWFLFLVRGEVLLRIKVHVSCFLCELRLWCTKCRSDCYTTVKNRVKYNQILFSSRVSMLLWTLLSYVQDCRNQQILLWYNLMITIQVSQCGMQCIA